MVTSNVYAGPGGLFQGDAAIVAGQIAASQAAVKGPCRVATTANVTIATALNAGDTIDGVTLAEGDRVLVWQQTAAAENGIYVAGATPFRAVDYDASEEIVGTLVPVVAGSTYGGHVFRNTNTGTIVVDTDDITFEEFGAGVDVAEEDGSPALSPATSLEVPDGGLTNDGGAALLEYGQRRHGGQDTIKAHGNMGATETFDPADGNVHTGTLNADCVVTLAQPVAAGAATIEAWFTQDATGGRALTMAAAGGGSFSWDGGTPAFDTTAGAVVRCVFERVPGTTNDWLGVAVGVGVQLSDATPLIEAGSGDPGVATEASRSDHVHPLAEQRILLADGHATPFTFNDLLQMDDGSDFMWSDP